MCDIVRIVKGKRELLEVARSMYLYLLGVPVGSAFFFLEVWWERTIIYIFLMDCVKKLPHHGHHKCSPFVDMVKAKQIDTENSNQTSKYSNLC